jgi:hypothetical protein
MVQRLALSLSLGLIRCKCKIKLSLHILWRHTGRKEVQFHSFLTLALDGGKWSASHPGCFTPEKQPWVATKKAAGWAPEMVWIILRKEKSCTAHDLKPGLLSPQPSHYTEYSIPAHAQSTNCISLPHWLCSYSKGEVMFGHSPPYTHKCCTGSSHNNILNKDLNFAHKPNPKPLILKQWYIPSNTIKSNRIYTSKAKWEAPEAMKK